jgi:hypothetical protein
MTWTRSRERPDTLEIVGFLKNMLTRQLASVIDRLASA